MHRRHEQCLLKASVALLLAGALAWPTIAFAQFTTTPSVTGQATAVQGSLIGLLGTVTSASLVSTAPLASTSDAQDASQLAGSALGLLTAETLSAATIGYPDQVDSVASLGSLNVNVAGIAISADVVMAEASQALGAPPSGSSTLGNLSVNGTPIAVSGAPNQTVGIPGGQIVINEQTVSPTGALVVNALHVTVNGVANFVIASATAGIS